MSITIRELDPALLFIRGIGAITARETLVGWRQVMDVVAAHEWQCDLLVDMRERTFTDHFPVSEMIAVLRDMHAPCMTTPHEKRRRFALLAKPGPTLIALRTLQTAVEAWSQFRVRIFPLPSLAAQWLRPEDVHTVLVAYDDGAT